MPKYQEVIDVDEETSPLLWRALEELHGLRNGPQCEGICDILETEITEPSPAAPRSRWPRVRKR